MSKVKLNLSTQDPLAGSTAHGTDVTHLFPASYIYPVNFKSHVIFNIATASPIAPSLINTDVFFLISALCLPWTLYLAKDVEIPLRNWRLMARLVFVSVPGLAMTVYHS